MNDFDKSKKTCLDKLYKPDKSRKGDVDKAIIPIIEHINSLKDFYTTSSCSGRIMLLTQAIKKSDVKWLYVTHDLTSYSDIMESLSEETLSQTKETIWMRQENLILHVSCRTMDNANNLLKIARNLGLSRSGIIADANNIVVEICSNEKMDVPIADNGKIIVDEQYINLIIGIANEKASLGKEKLLKLESEIKRNLN
jgi:tRNA wybutosine-synthesizing protein 3